MKQHNFNLLLTVLFCLFIGGMFLGSLILPDRAFSQLENRNLEQAPKISLEAIDTGKFMEDAEDYVNDQIIGRDFWVALKAWSERLSGKQENNGHQPSGHPLLGGYSRAGGHPRSAGSSDPRRICQCLGGQCGCAGVFRHHPLRR